MTVNSTGGVCAIDDENCGTGNTYPVTVRPTIGGGGSGGGTGGGGTGGGGTGGGDGIDGVVTAVIDRLANVIEFSHLAQSLRSRIDIINTLEHGLNDFSTKVATDNSVMAQQLLGLRGDLTDAVAYINSKVTIELNERQALVNSINQIVASLGNGLSAAIQEESTVRAEQTGALFAERSLRPIWQDTFLDTGCLLMQIRQGLSVSFVLQRIGSASLHLLTLTMPHHLVIKCMMERCG